MEKVRLGDICSVRGGYAFKSELFKSEGTPIIRIGNITKDGLIIDEDVCYDEKFWDENDSYRVEKNDILIAMSGATVGKSCLNNTEKKLLLNQRVASIRCNDTQLKYVFHSINSEKFAKYIAMNSIGCAQPNVSIKQISDFEVPNICIENQKRIAGELDKVTDLIDKRKKQLSKLDELVKARFVELFGDPVSNPRGWETKRFDALCENLDSRRKPITAYEREAGIYPYYGASGVVDYVADYLFDEDILLVSEDGANLLMRSTPIAFSVNGKVWVNNHAHVVRFEKMSMQKYIEVFFSMIDISEHITGSAQPKLNQAKLNAMMFPVPDDDRLEAFLSFVEQTDKSKSEVQKSLEKLEILKKALMQKYFG